jgi:tetraacyldisaccharide 4'-kinase
MNVFLKVLLSPFSILYGVITYLRNILFDLKILKSKSFTIPVISAGNINTGGTGKTPFIEFLIRILQNNNIRIATLSRGYGRKTKGFFVANDQSTAENLGDEPLQFYGKFPDAIVSVCEDRVEGIQKLLQLHTPPEVILLDDAYQHRSVKPGLNCLLTDYSNLYIHDSMLPSGSLREFPLGAKRADIIIITKSPEDLSEEEKEIIIRILRPKPHQMVLFSYLHYGDLIPFSQNKTSLEKETFESSVLLFTGIANSRPLEIFLKSHFREVVTVNFSDHHAYTTNDLNQILNKFSNFGPGNNMIITTEKDFIRLKHHPDLKLIQEFPVYYMPVEMRMSVQDYQYIEKRVLDYVRKN